MKVINPLPRPVTLRRNAKVADAFPCMALEDFETDELVASAVPPPTLQQQVLRMDGNSEGDNTSADSLTIDSGPECNGAGSEVLRMLGLGDIDVDSPQLSPEGRAKLVQLIARYESIFSRHKLDCGKATGFVHRIRLSDDRHFRLPYRRLSPNQYDKLRQALDEMEECEIGRATVNLPPCLFSSGKSLVIYVCALISGGSTHARLRMLTPCHTKQMLLRP